MTFSQIKTRITKHLVNARGWNTRRRIVVIESDDWGTIRMPSRAVYDRLLKAGYKVDQCPYNKYDSLADERDLTGLFELLLSFKDKNGRPPVITANNIVANPDFEKIRASGFRTYHYEPFPETLRRYPGCAGSLELWKEGMAGRVFHPQFHGREHINVTKWMKGLGEGDKALRLAFDHQMISFNDSVSPNCVKATMDALTIDSEAEIEILKSILEDGLELFEQLWRFRSKSFIAPCYFWPSALEQVLRSSGVLYYQGNLVQKDPRALPGNKFRKIYHYLGQKNRYGQLFLVRNCYFEPSFSPQVDWVGACMKEISTAFKWRKPAIISAHRLNFIGSIDSANRDKNLKLLKELLTGITRKWPDAEFMTSDELGDLINNRP